MVQLLFLAWAGVVDNPYVFHSIRHGSAGHAKLLGIPLSVIQSWLRHKNVNTTEHYCQYLLSEILSGTLPLGSVRSLDQVDNFHFCYWFGLV